MIASYFLLSFIMFSVSKKVDRTFVRWSAAFFAASILLSAGQQDISALLDSVPVAHAAEAAVVSDTFTREFTEAIDGLSVRFTVKGTQERAQLEVQAFNGSVWSAWQKLEVENEQDPDLLESNMVMFPAAVHAVRFRGTSAVYAVHPLRVSSAPASYDTAALGTVAPPHILSRKEWGADETLRIAGTASSASTPADEATDGPSSDTKITGTSQRALDCMDAQIKYPEEFRRNGKVVTELDGKKLLWPQEYSPKVKMLVVHHTAVAATGETRSGPERMRALYQYHAKSRGWGDIGYNYVIDDTGQIYEGRAGGDSVIGGHAYCHNTGTIGISLMGNFEVEQPTQGQMKALQWLLSDLSTKYSINLDGNVKTHGDILPAIVGHRQLVSTECPGYYAYAVLDQVRRNVARGEVDTAIKFPPGPSAIAIKPTKLIPNVVIGTKGTFFYQDADLVGRPGGEVSFTLRFQAGSKPLAQRTSIATIARSDERMNVWVVDEQESMRLRNNLLLMLFLRKGESTTFTFRVQLPPDAGNYQLSVGDLDYVLKADGRRVRTVTKVGARRVQRLLSAPLARRSYLNTVAVKTSQPVVNTITADASAPRIRIRLLSDVASPTDTVIHTSSSVQVNDANDISGNIFLTKEGNDCKASGDSGVLGSGVIRIDPKNGILTLNDWKKSLNQFRGILECRVVNGELVLIDELPIDWYMQGLAEEPDTEPYEKQRAFAIAARTYAEWYMDARNRKFAGKPYDGSDSPAEFQKYSGYLFENNNPHWLDAVHTTAGQVLKKDGQIIKPPYFSSSNGRTLSPEEAGWKKFPFADIFVSKPDPWCEGMQQRGHGVGMSGCGAKGQANDGKKAEEILQYYYPGTTISKE
ncbi:MAG: N-acetylmuramoyl-L-alanine amidase family 2 protein [Candidatus Peribacteria bacterium]|nr:N-acetylmuramoyl-L-alanine amidase family 2 protein [Candidatus Peribacteria bacterium]